MNQPLLESTRIATALMAEPGTRIQNVAKEAILLRDVAREVQPLMPDLIVVFNSKVIPVTASDTADDLVNFYFQMLEGR